MRKPRFSPDRRESRRGGDRCRPPNCAGVSDTTFYTWRSRRWQLDERKSGCAELRRALARQQEQIRRQQARLKHVAGGGPISG